MPVLGTERGEGVFTPHSLMHIGGGSCFLGSLLVGGTAVLLDIWSGERGLTVLRDAEVSWLRAAPR